MKILLTSIFEYFTYLRLSISAQVKPKVIPKFKTVIDRVYLQEYFYVVSKTKELTIIQRRASTIYKQLKEKGIDVHLERHQKLIEML